MVSKDCVISRMACVMPMFVRLVVEWRFNGTLYESMSLWFNHWTLMGFYGDSMGFPWDIMGVMRFHRI